jgi:hypothetical protein
VSDYIATYAGWGQSDAYVQGVFFDETPNEYTEAIGSFYDSIDSKVKGNSGFKGDQMVSRQARVIYIDAVLIQRLRPPTDCPQSRYRPRRHSRSTQTRCHRYLRAELYFILDRIHPRDAEHRVVQPLSLVLDRSLGTVGSDRQFDR